MSNLKRKLAEVQKRSFDALKDGMNPGEVLYRVSGKHFVAGGRGERLEGRHVVSDPELGSQQDLQAFPGARDGEGVDRGKGGRRWRKVVVRGANSLARLAKGADVCWSLWRSQFCNAHDALRVRLEVDDDA